MAQPITAAQQKALNAYVDYANQSASEVNRVVQSIVAYYPSLQQQRSWGAPRYTCPVQLDDYYYTIAINLGKNLSPVLSSKLKDLRAVAEKIDGQCKALDTYHKLEDYKQDNFAKAGEMIRALPQLLRDYQQKQRALQKELESVYSKMQPSSAAYRTADNFMRNEILHQRNMLDAWTMNLQEDIHTGWPVDKLEQTILETDQQITAMQKMKPALKYPASSMWNSFQGNLAAVLEIQRSGLNDYNFEARKSDKHSNDVYLDLINYLNGTLTSDYNSFIQFATNDGYYGLKMIQYFPLFEIRSEPASSAIQTKPFVDIPRIPVSIAPQKTSLSKLQYEALLNYIAYINETWWQTRNLQSTLENFSSSAAYFKTLESYEKHGPLHFDYKDFHIPKAEYQKAIADSKNLPPAVAKAINDQAEVLLRILTELDELSAFIAVTVSERAYEKDHVAGIYTALERLKILFSEWDKRKELLYQDVRSVFDAYPAANPSSSWYISGRVLRNLAQLDHDALFQAKAYYTGDSTIVISTTAIDAAVRDVIAKEYDNMKGIQKIGRSNGLCPYTPYEDLPETSRSLSEALKELKPANASRYEHPYHRMVYHYNDIVDDYNKFCELSTSVQHLPTIHQPELFFIRYPQAVSSNKETGNPAVVKKQEQPPVTQPQQQQPATKNTSTVGVQHDTVYIVKRDTVYIPAAGEDLHSMEGYALNNMILLLDVSGSMNTPDKLPLLKNAVLSMIAMMRPEDKVSIIAFSDKPKVLLESVSFKDEAKISKAINNLKSAGKTDGNAGLKLAYKTADENYIRGGNNRIVLATDGEFATAEETLQLIRQFSGEDIFLTIFNFGKGTGSSKTLEGLATQGKGNYAHITRENVELNLIREAKAKRINR
ncbi:MAG TPA: VWA domain-containing protein [Ohtaekwangia sp.]